MEKTERNKILNEISGTSYYKAIMDLVVEEIVKLQDIDKIESEIDLKAAQKSTRALKRIFNFLKICKKDIKTQTKNQYE